MFTTLPQHVFGFLFEIHHHSHLNIKFDLPFSSSSPIITVFFSHVMIVALSLWITVGHRNPNPDDINSLFYLISSCFDFLLCYFLILIFMYIYLFFDFSDRLILCDICGPLVLIPIILLIYIFFATGFTSILILALPCSIKSRFRLCHWSSVSDIASGLPWY